MNVPDRTLPTDALGEALPPAHARAADPGEAASLTVALSQTAHTVPPQLGKRLRQRVAAQVAANAELFTVRRPLAQAPQAGATGQRWWPLSLQSRIVELDAGAELALEPGTHELLLLGGVLHAGGERLNAQDYALGDGSQPLRAEQACRFYLRRHGEQSDFRAEPGWRCVPRSDDGWQPLREGVELRPLHLQGRAVTMFARFAAGGRVPAHPHGIDEECLMVEGELFLGDVLLREGGYQRAPGGSSHGELFADGACLLFFHGAIDPAAVDNSHRAQHGFPAL